MPHLADIATDYAEKGIQVVTLNYQESVSIVRDFQEDYPQVLFLLDDGAIYNLYKQNGYVPLNYVLNHDMAQTIEYWEEGFTEELMRDTIEDVRSPVVATLIPEADSYAPGDTISYELKVKNWTLLSQQVYVVLSAVLPSGGSRRLGTTSLSFTAYEEKIIPLEQVIPMSGVPAGDFKMRVQIGLPPADLWNADYFDFTITP